MTILLLSKGVGSTDNNYTEPMVDTLVTIPLVCSHFEKGTAMSHQQCVVSWVPDPVKGGMTPVTCGEIIHNLEGLIGKLAADAVLTNVEDALVEALRVVHETTH